MASAKDPTPSTATSAPAAPPADGIQGRPADNIPLPPPKTQPVGPVTADWRAYALRRLDAGLVIAALGLAFLLASFAVKNSDFWMHLAAGRLVAQGNIPNGQDPFAYTTEGVYWANHAWLFDLGLYGLYQLGGPVVVAVKALLVVALAAVMLAIR